jgi:hypothetical protein
MSNNQQLLLGEGAGGGPPSFIEDVFSTWLYTGTNSQQTITNGIDLSTKGGLVWVKSRSDSTNHKLLDSAQAGTATNWDYSLTSNSTAASTYYAQVPILAQATGFRINSPDSAFINESGYTYASWTFRKQPKFFDVVTYTGNGSSRTIAHSLNSVPGCIIVKRTDTTGAWQVYHRANTANPETDYLVLNSTAATADSDTRWNDTLPTSTVFSLGTDATVNASGGTYVAYLFAHDAGGFGLTGLDNVISCGSYTGNGSATGPVITLGYEPQWVMVKEATVGGAGRDWLMFDSMRGMTASPGIDFPLRANTSQAEDNGYGEALEPTATGFKINVASGSINSNGNTFIYIAIRRGPMKVPTSGTSVFAPALGVSSSSAPFMTVETSFTVDGHFMLSKSNENKYEASRLQGTGKILITNSTAAEASNDYPAWDRQTGVGSNVGNSGFNNYITYNFRRAPGFFDVVCYTGTGVARTVAHNLAAVPELMIIKNRTTGIRYWAVYSGNLGVSFAIALNDTAAAFSGTSSWNGTAPTSSVFTVNTHTSVNESGGNYVAYLFATCAGVSKVGSYTGTGTTLQINCGFTGGARFVLIKRTDSTGDWYVWDTARGIIAGNDPYLLLNSSAAEVTSTDYVDTYSAGFEISSTAPAAINASGGTFIFLAIA